MEKSLKSKTHCISILCFLPLAITCFICLYEYLKQDITVTSSVLSYPWFIVIPAILSIICQATWLWYIIIVKRIEADIDHKNAYLSEQNLKDKVLMNRYNNDVLQRTSNDKTRNAIDLIKYFQDLDSDEKNDELKKNQQIILSDFIIHQLEFVKKHDSTIETKLNEIIKL